MLNLKGGVNIRIMNTVPNTTTEVNVTPVPGVVLVEPTQEETTINYGNTKGRIGLGKVIAYGAPIANKDGSEKKCPVEINDTVYFLTYEGGYDRCVINGKAYVFAMFDDLRGKVNG